MVVTNTLKIMRATMLLLATSNGVGVNVRLVGYSLSVSRYQGFYRQGVVNAARGGGKTMRGIIVAMEEDDETMTGICSWTRQCSRRLQLTTERTMMTRARGGGRE